MHVWYCECTKGGLIDGHCILRFDDNKDGTDENKNWQASYDSCVQLGDQFPPSSNYRGRLAHIISKELLRFTKAQVPWHLLDAVYIL